MALPRGASEDPGVQGGGPERPPPPGLGQALLEEEEEEGGGPQAAPGTMWPVVVRRDGSFPRPLASTPLQAKERAPLFGAARRGEGDPPDACGIGSSARRALQGPLRQPGGSGGPPSGGEARVVNKSKAWHLLWAQVLLCVRLGGQGAAEGVRGCRGRQRSRKRKNKTNKK